MPKSYATDILPLFRDRDLACMARREVMLEDPAFMCAPAGDAHFPDHANARQVFARLTDEMRPMPPDGRWPRSQIDAYADWMADGFQP